jgi:hypothetical protein
MSEFDELERQLRESVRAVGARRRRGVPRVLPMVLVPIVLLGGAAGATGVLSGASVRSRAGDLEQELRAGVAIDGPCRPGRLERLGGATFSDAAPLPEVVRAFPDLARPPARGVPGEVLAEAATLATGAIVLRRAVRVAEFPDGTRLLLVVTASNPWTSVVDPARCRERRLDALAARRSRTDPAIYERARKNLARALDTDQAAQTFTIASGRRRPNGTGGGGSSSSPVQPGHPIRTARSWSSTTHAFSFVAAPRAVTVTVRRVRPGSPARAWRGPGAYAGTIRVREGLVGFRGRGGTDGRYRVTQYDRSGRVVARNVRP